MLLLAFVKLHARTFESQSHFDRFNFNLLLCLNELKKNLILNLIIYQDLFDNLKHLLNSIFFILIICIVSIIQINYFSIRFEST